MKRVVHMSFNDLRKYRQDRYGPIIAGITVCTTLKLRHNLCNFAPLILGAIFLAVMRKRLACTDLVKSGGFDGTYLQNDINDLLAGNNGYRKPNSWIFARLNKIVKLRKIKQWYIG